jgi:hypothetical protein
MIQSVVFGNLVSEALNLCARRPRIGRREGQLTKAGPRENKVESRVPIRLPNDRVHSTTSDDCGSHWSVSSALPRTPARTMAPRTRRRGSEVDAGRHRPRSQLRAQLHPCPYPRPARGRDGWRAMAEVATAGYRIGRKQSWRGSQARALLLPLAQLGLDGGTTGLYGGALPRAY